MEIFEQPQIATATEAPIVVEAAQVISEPENDFDFALLHAKVEKSYGQISLARRTRKYYKRRYHLFHRFDDGILLADRECWYSVTPEAVAAHCARSCLQRLAPRGSNCVVLDAFCGSGGNTIQLAKCFDRVIATDIDFNKLQCAAHNVQNVYGLNNVDFIVQDYFLVTLHKT